MADSSVKDQILKDIFKGSTPKDCADRYGVPSGTIRSWLSRDRDKGMAKKIREKQRRLAQEKSEVKHFLEEGKAQKDFLDSTVAIEDVSSDLTEMERFFCFFYIQNFNAPLAAIKAGFPQEIAARAGPELMCRADIREEIQRLKRRKLAQAMLSEEDVLIKYMQIAFMDFTDAVDLETGKILDGVDGGLIKEVNVTEDGIKLKMEDRMRALEFLARYFKMYPMDSHKMEYNSKIIGLKEKELKMKEF